MSRDRIDAFEEVRRRVGVVRDASRQSCPNGIFFSVFSERIELLRGGNQHLFEASLPNRQLVFKAKRESSFDQLDCLFERDIRCGCEKDVQVIWHHHERMQGKSTLFAIVSEDIEKKGSVGVDFEERAAIGGDSGDKKCTSLLRTEDHSADLRIRA